MFSGSYFRQLLSMTVGRESTLDLILFVLEKGNLLGNLLFLGIDVLNIDGRYNVPHHQDHRDHGFHSNCPRILLYTRLLFRTPIFCVAFEISHQLDHHDQRQMFRGILR